MQIDFLPGRSISDRRCRVPGVLRRLELLDCISRLGIMPLRVCLGRRGLVFFASCLPGLFSVGTFGKTQRSGRAAVLVVVSDSQRVPVVVPGKFPDGLRMLYFLCVVHWLRFLLEGVHLADILNIPGVSMVSGLNCSPGRAPPPAAIRRGSSRPASRGFAPRRSGNSVPGPDIPQFGTQGTNPA